MNFPRSSHQVSTPDRYRSLVVVLICSMLSGCTMQAGTPKIEIPPSSSDFRNRLYAGASFGNSRLSSSSTLEVEQSSAVGTQLRLGYDVHDRVAVELDTSVLGDSPVRGGQSDLSYVSASVSALVYGLSGVQIRSRREGLSAYARLGFGSLRKSSDISELEGSETVPIFGVGAEYGLSGGLGLRAEITRFDSDVSYVGLGAVFRFGIPSTGIGQMIARAAEPSLAAARGADSTSPTAAVTALTMADRWRPAMRAGDTDADGVLDTLDACPETTTYVTVDKTGCGLFDAVLSDVKFRSGSSWLSPRARSQLDELAETLLAFPESRVQVRAHTDSQGSRNMNLMLSNKRAEVVAQYLKSRGVHDRQLQAMGVGEAQPLVSNRTPEGRRSNRRVDVVTLPDQDAGELSIQPVLAAARVIVVSDPRKRNSRRDDPVGKKVGEVNVSKVRNDSKKHASKTPEKKVEEPALKAAKPAEETGRSKLPIMPLPEPGFAPGVNISGIVEGLYFSSGSSELTADARNSLMNVIAAMHKNPGIRIAIMAHTDDRGNAKDNLALSMRRAQSVATYLGNEGVAANRIEAEGYGEMLPLVQNVTDADRATNRRIEIRILSSH